MQKKPFLICLEPKERLGGYIYLPFYFILLSLGLQFLFSRFGLSLTDTDVQVYMNIAYGAVNSAVLGLLFRRYLVRNARQIRRFPKRFVLSVPLGFLIYYVGTFFIGILIQIAAPGMVNENNAAFVTMSENPWVFLYAVILAPIVEELLFRGLVFSTLRPKNRILAYAVTMAVFSAIHIVGYLTQYTPLQTVLCFLQYLPAAFALCWVLEYSGSIYASITVHMLANLISMVVLKTAG